MKFCFEELRASVLRSELLYHSNSQFIIEATISGVAFEALVQVLPMFVDKRQPQNGEDLEPLEP